MPTLSGTRMNGGWHHHIVTPNHEYFFHKIFHSDFSVGLEKAYRFSKGSRWEDLSLSRTDSGTLARTRIRPAS